MIAFEVTRTGCPATPCGHPGTGYWGVILTSAAPGGITNPVAPPPGTELSVGGVDENDEYMDWIKADLAVDDEVVVRVIDTCQSSPPISRRNSDMFLIPRTKDEAQRRINELQTWVHRIEETLRDLP